MPADHKTGFDTPSAEEEFLVFARRRSGYLGRNICECVTTAKESKGGGLFRRIFAHLDEELGSNWPNTISGWKQHETQDFSIFFHYAEDFLKKPIAITGVYECMNAREGIIVNSAFAKYITLESHPFWGDLLGIYNEQCIKIYECGTSDHLTKSLVEKFKAIKISARQKSVFMNHAADWLARLQYDK